MFSQMCVSERGRHEKHGFLKRDDGGNVFDAGSRAEERTFNFKGRIKRMCTKENMCDQKRRYKNIPIIQQQKDGTKTNIFQSSCVCFDVQRQ